MPSIHSNDSSVYIVHNPIVGAMEPHLIKSDNDDESIANIFAFGTFADKNNGIVYHDLTGHSRSCHWMEVSVSLFCTITN
jgi:hypothetical protein